MEDADRRTKGVEFCMLPHFIFNGALVATVELLNGIEMTWVQFPYAPPFSRLIVTKLVFIVLHFPLVRGMNGWSVKA